MRIEVTVREADGTERDVALLAPLATATGAVLAALRRALPGPPIGWVDTRRLDESARFDPSYIPRGAVLTTAPAGPVDSLGPRLDVIGGPSAGRSVPLAHGVTTLGRNVSCDLVLADPRVSRHHAEVSVTGNGVMVRDLGSTSGTFVNGIRVGEATQFKAGDTMRVGDSRLAIRTAPVDRRAATAPPDVPIIEWPSDPPRDLHRAQLAAAVIPAVAGVVLAAVLRSIEFLAFALLSPLTLAASSTAERRRSRRTNRALRHALVDARAVVERNIAGALAAERDDRLDALPDPLTVLRTAAASNSAPSRSSALAVRLGLGAAPSTVQVRIGDAVSPAGQLQDVPIPVDLADGPCAIVGPRAAREAAARWLIGQLAVQSAPDDLEIVLLASSTGSWHWLRWLPHLRERVACTPAECADTLGDLSTLIAQRRGTSDPSPAHLCIVAVDAAAARPLAAVFTAPAGAGVTGLVLADVAPAAVPPDRVVRISGDTATRAIVGAGPEIVLDQVGEVWADRLARLLARTRADASRTRLPAQCALADLIGLEPATPTAVRERWLRGDGALHVPIGVSSDGPVELDLVRDGPHCLIAGTTGSGKSELLQSLLASLAANYPPGELTFLLVDYKGGAALAPFATLPHTVGIVTDLDDYLGRRVLTALRSELRYRERLLAGVGAADLAGYRRAGLALPRLLLVVDELAALSESFRGLVPGLVEIAQRGRSLGVHLILSTQRPSGVVSADIRANVGLCIALRTTSAAESVDVVGDAAAATIAVATPGRAYLRAGPQLSEVQCARVSRPAAHAATRVELLDDWLRVRAGGQAPLHTDLDRIVAAIRTAAEGRPLPRRPWLPPLPAHVAVADLPAVDDPAALTIGLADLPDEQRRIAATVDPGAGSVVFTGGPRSGRTGALVCLALAAAERTPPAHLEIHAVGAVAARVAMRTLPHVGTLAPLADGGRLAARLVERLAADARVATRAQDDTRCLLLVDDWETLAEATEQLDSGRTVDRILALARDGASTGTTVALAGGRTTVAPRVTSSAHTRFVLRLTERSDFPAAGIEPSAVPVAMPPGRAVRVGDGVEVQLCDPSEHEARAAACNRRWPASQRRVVLRPLPRTVHLRDLSPPGGWLLGAGGDAATPISIDPRAGRRRLLVAGPPGSGRTTVLRLLLAQSTGATTFAAAQHGDSPLALAARHHGLRTVFPDDPGDAVPPPDGVLLVDDAESFVDTAIGAALLAWLRATPSGAAVVAARSDALAVSGRGLAAEIARAGCGLLLQPGPLDGELLGARLPRPLSSELPGRGLLVPDPAWQLGREPIPIQIALSDRPDQRMCG